LLLNLIMNGCDAMGDVQDIRRLTVRTRAEPPGAALLEVVDEGTGIAPAALERIFIPFVTTKASGMGLGLTVCRSIIEAHRGRLWASNNPDGGATLHVSIPSVAAA